MSDFAQAKNPHTPFTELPSAQGAADDLRAAADEKAQSGRQAARALKESAVEKAQQVRETATAKAAVFKEAATAKAAKAKDMAGEKAAQLKGIASEQWQETRVKARELHATTEDYIRPEPDQGRAHRRRRRLRPRPDPAPVRARLIFPLGRKFWTRGGACSNSQRGRAPLPCFFLLPHGLSARPRRRALRAP